MTSFQQIVHSPWKLRLFLLAKLPVAYFSGVRVRYFDGACSEVSVPYKWFSTNPFKSTYFACLAMAAEMSTGLLSMAAVYGKKPGVSMLVVRMEAEYYKKAVGRTDFICEDGTKLVEAVQSACTTGEGTEVTAKSTGRNSAGETVAVFSITWSFKQKKL